MLKFKNNLITRLKSQNIFRKHFRKDIRVVRIWPKSVTHKLFGELINFFTHVRANKRLIPSANLPENKK